MLTPIVNMRTVNLQRLAIAQDLGLNERINCALVCGKIMQYLSPISGVLRSLPPF